MNPDDTQTEIATHFADLSRRLGELGPLSKIKDPDLKTCASLLQQLLAFVEINRTGEQPDEDFQRRMLRAAREVWSEAVIQRDIVPALAANSKLTAARKTEAERRKREAAKRVERLRAEAEKLRAMDPTLTKEAIAAILSDRDMGGKHAIAKKL